ANESPAGRLRWHPTDIRLRATGRSNPDAGRQPGPDEPARLHECSRRDSRGRGRVRATPATMAAQWLSPIVGTVAHCLNLVAQNVSRIGDSVWPHSTRPWSHTRTCETMHASIHWSAPLPR